jgi:signal transduction histidine kinase
MKVNALSSCLPSDENESRTAEVDTLLERAVQDIKTLTFQLRPPILANAGLISALKWLAEDFSVQYGLLTSIEGDRDVVPMRAEVSSMVFQVVRELLLNIVKHAGIRRAAILLRRDAGVMIITVSDDGHGFNVMQMFYAGKEPRGLGLINIREKIEYLGGRLAFDSSPGCGTRVTVTVPLESVALPHGR